MATARKARDGVAATIRMRPAMFASYGIPFCPDGPLVLLSLSYTAVTAGVVGGVIQRRHVGPFTGCGVLRGEIRTFCHALPFLACPGMSSAEAARI